MYVCMYTHTHTQDTYTHTRTHTHARTHTQVVRSLRTLHHRFNPITFDPYKCTSIDFCEQAWPSLYYTSLLHKLVQVY